MASYEALGPSKTRCTKPVIISVSVAVSIVIGVGIFLAIYFVEKNNHTHDPPPAPGRDFTLPDFLTGTFSPAGISVTWLPDSSGYLYAPPAEPDTLYKVSTTVLNEYNQTLFLNTSQIKVNGQSYAAYWVSHDSAYILFAFNYQKLWRHSFYADYYVYSMASETLTRVGPLDRSISNCVWNPQYTAVAYVDNNDIYVQNVSAVPLEAPARVTFDGSKDVLNGFQGWVYEEEVFSDTIALWWSPDGSLLAFFKTNETLVETFEYPWYGDIDKDAYQQMSKIKYPKAGAPNPVVQTYVYNLATHTLPTLMNIPQPDYITWVGWKSASELLIRTLDRSQQIEYLYTTNPITGAVNHQFPTQVAASNGWIDFLAGPLMVDDDSFLILRNNSGFYHIARINATDGMVVAFLTSGNFDVTLINAYDPVAKAVYFTSAEVSPVQRHVYRVNLDGSAKTALSQPPGYFSANFNPAANYYILRNGGPSPPRIYLSPTNPDGAPLTLVDNQALTDKLLQYQVPNKTMITIPVNGEELNAYMLKPPSFDENKKYPLIMQVYGGPGSQTVTMSYSMGWQEFLCSNLSVIVVSVDGRGTGARGLQFMQQTYKQLGILESDDQIAAAQWLASNHNFIDGARIGLWGWSYGGFMTLTVLSRSDVLRTGISVAPVTDWRLYDSAYTEKFMSTPALNPEGYDLSSNLKRAANVTSDRLLLIHGTGDDNVHFQNSAEMVKELVKKEKEFWTMYYPNSDHGINYEGATRHLYTLMWKHWKMRLVE